MKRQSGLRTGQGGFRTSKEGIIIRMNRDGHLGKVSARTPRPRVDESPGCESRVNGPLSAYYGKFGLVLQ